jgi:coenzyme F420-reducing hydrogenase delta subunit
LEKELGPKVRFFPLPCSGRIEALHFLKALETGARKVYLVACPEGACRYGQGNVRARKRLDFAKALVREVGLSDDCLELVTAPGAGLASMDDITRRLLGLKPHKA